MVSRPPGVCAQRGHKKNPNKNSCKSHFSGKPSVTVEPGAPSSAAAAAGPFLTDTHGRSRRLANTDPLSKLRPISCAQTQPGIKSRGNRKLIKMKLAQRYKNYPSPSVTYLFFSFFCCRGERITWILIEILFYLSLELLMDPLAVLVPQRRRGGEEKKKRVGKRTHKHIIRRTVRVSICEFCSYIIQRAASETAPPLPYERRQTPCL